MSNKIKRFFKKYGLKILFWLLIVAVIALATINIRLAFVFDGKFANAFTAISGWVSFLATILVGHIAYKQNKEYKLENDKFIQEQKDLAWRNNYVELVQRFSKQFNEHLTNLSKYYPHKLEAIFLKNLDEKCFYDYELQVSDFEDKINHFLIFLRKSQIFNKNHKELYDAFILLYYALNQLLDYFNNVLNKEKSFDRGDCGLLIKKALHEYRKFVDLAYVYKENLSRLISDIYESDINTLKISWEYQKIQKEKWYEEVRDIPSYIQKLINDKKDD